MDSIDICDVEAISKCQIHYKILYGKRSLEQSYFIRTTNAISYCIKRTNKLLIASICH